MTSALLARPETPDLAAPSKLLNRGRYANADVRLYADPAGGWVVKDFTPRAWLVRATVGRWMLSRELRALRLLQGLPGIAQDAHLATPYALAYRFIPGQTLRDAAPDQLTTAFFRRLERLVWRMHKRGVAHLDLRYRRNILVQPSGEPAIIDFQSFVPLFRCPPRARKALRRVDLSGVYKHWCLRQPETLGDRRMALLKASNRMRSFWILAGYKIKRKKAGWRGYELQAAGTQKKG